MLRRFGKEGVKMTMKIDPLEIMSNLKSLIPIYDPFFSAENHEIVGYEVIGKYVKNNKALGADPFFMDDTIPEEDRMVAYLHLIKSSIEYFLQEKQTGFLAIRMNPKTLLFDEDEKLLQFILSKRDEGFMPSQFILILPEESLKGIEDMIDHYLHYLKTFEIKIAIENIELSGVRLERIAPLSPHFIRIHLSSLKSHSKAAGFEDTIYGLSLFARKTGSTLIFDKIEMEHQFMFALKNGGRYYQGPFLASASPIFIRKDKEKQRLKKEWSRFIAFEKRRLTALQLLEQTLNEELHDVLGMHGKSNEFEQLIIDAANILGTRAFRIYVCDENGFQLSSNLFRNQNQWTQQKEYKGKNWSWRPYFLENIFKMNVTKRGILSDLYCDIETGELIRTFSIPITAQFFMLVDLSYAYLYEEENLL